MSSEEKLPLQNLEDVPPVNYASVAIPDSDGDGDGLNSNGEAASNEYSTKRPFDENFTPEFWNKVRC